MFEVRIILLCLPSILLASTINGKNFLKQIFFPPSLNLSFIQRMSVFCVAHSFFFWIFFDTFSNISRFKWILCISILFKKHSELFSRCAISSHPFTAPHSVSVCVCVCVTSALFSARVVYLFSMFTIAFSLIRRYCFFFFLLYSAPYLLLKNIVADFISLFFSFSLRSFCYLYHGNKTSEFPMCFAS